MLESDKEELNIYITNSTSIIKDKLTTYLEEKQEDKKVSFKSLDFVNIPLIFLYILFNKIILIFKQIKSLDYWNLNSAKFPVLAILARKYLGIPASSASSKQFFSQGAFIISKLQNRLNKDTFEMIACLKSWGVFKDEIEEEKKEENKEKEISKEDNQFVIIENEE